MSIFKTFDNLKINIKLTVAFFFIAFFSILVIGFLSYVKGKNSLEEESFKMLTAVREMKASQIEDYFDDISNQIITFSEDHTIIDAMNELSTGFDTITSELDLSLQENIMLEQRLEKYYNEEYLTRLYANVKVSEHKKDHWPTHKSSLILQDYT